MSNQDLHFTFDDIANQLPDELDRMQPYELNALRDLMREVGDDSESRMNASYLKQDLGHMYEDSEKGSNDQVEEIDDAPENKLQKLSGSLIQFNYYTFMKFIGSCSVNLLLPFINGLMLGFGELLAHEISWRHNWFDRRNTKAFKVYPESRKFVGLNKSSTNTTGIEDDKITVL